MLSVCCIYDTDHREHRSRVERVCRCLYFLDFLALYMTGKMFLVRLGSYWGFGVVADSLA